MTRDAANTALRAASLQVYELRCSASQRRSRQLPHPHAVDSALDKPAFTPVCSQAGSQRPGASSMSRAASACFDVSLISMRPTCSVKIFRGCAGWVGCRLRAPRAVHDLAGAVRLSAILTARTLQPVKKWSTAASSLNPPGFGFERGFDDRRQRRRRVGGCVFVLTLRN